MPVKRVIPDCAHDFIRMLEWAKEGACPICLTAANGILNDEMRFLRKGWISVAEQMPEPEIPVLVCWNGSNRVKKQVGKCAYFIVEDGDGKYWYEAIFDEPTDWLPEELPTHWRPLPESA